MPLTAFTPAKADKSGCALSAAEALAWPAEALSHRRSSGRPRSPELLLERLGVALARSSRLSWPASTR